MSRALRSTSSSTSVAPNVKLAGIKGSNDAGFFFPEMVVCSFMWAGSQHLDVTNNSYFADPFLYKCHGKMRPGQVEQHLNHTADPIPCPEQSPFDPAVGSSRPELTGLFVAECQGSQTLHGYNGFYGYGR